MSQEVAAPGAGSKPGGQSKLDRWIQRTAGEKNGTQKAPESAAQPAPAEPTAPVPKAGLSKLDRWMNRATEGKQHSASQPSQPLQATPGAAQSPPANNRQSTSQSSIVSAVPEDPSKSHVCSNGVAGPITPRNDQENVASNENPDEDTTPQAKWGRMVYTGGEYEGEALKSPHGFGRNIWDSGMAYHGNWADGEMNGTGRFIFPNGDTYEGEFKAHKPCGWGVFTTKATSERRRVKYDGTIKFSEGAQPVETEEAPPDTIDKSERVMMTGVAKGHKDDPPNVGDFSHCKGKEFRGVRLVHTVPLRAHQPLLNADDIRGKFAVAQRGWCSFSKKIRHCQEAGAIGLVIIGTDDNSKYNQVFRVHEGDPRDDDTWPEDAVPPPIKVGIPVCYCLGKAEKVLKDGAIVTLSFLPNSPSPIWLLACMIVNKQTIFPELKTKADRDKLFEEFQREREQERRQDLNSRWQAKGEQEWGEQGAERCGGEDGGSGVGEVLRRLGLQVEQLGLVDAWLAGQSGAMSFTAVQPTFRLSPEEEPPLSARSQGSRAKQEGREMTERGRREEQSRPKASFEMGVGEALLQAFTGRTV